MTTNPFSQESFDFQNADPLKRASFAYGKKLASTFVQSIKTDREGYFTKRNQRIERNTMFARGRQPMQEFLDLLGIDGKRSFLNLDMKPPAIAPVFMELLIGGMMEREERPTVNAVDSYSKEKKAYQSKEAAYRMRQGEAINEMSQNAGVPLEDPEAFVPEDEQDLQLWEETEQHLTEEIGFQKLIKNVLDDNSYEVLKRRALDDLAEAGYVVGKVYRDSNGNLKIRNCIARNCYYTYTDFDDFKDVLLIGEMRKIKIVDMRLMYPKLDEATLFKMYVATIQDPLVYDWQERWRTSQTRPYDDALVEVFEFGVKAAEDVMYLQKIDSFGKKLMTKIQEQPKSISSNEKVITKRLGVIYEGVYCTSIDYMIKWELMKNAIKPHWELHEVMHPYCIYMPQNREMVNMAMIERAETNIIQMTVDLLKMQQLISELRPDEIAIDVTLLGDINLGQGVMKPFQTQKLFQQTGKLYYKGEDDGGEKAKRPPMTPLPLSSTPAKIQMLMENYNFHLQQLKLYLGSDPSIESQSINPRLSPTIQNNQVAASNRSTSFVYDSYIQWLQGIAKRIAVMCWDDIVLGGKKYEGVERKDIEKMIFDINISMLPTLEERNYIDQMVTTSLTAKIITFEEGFKVRRIAKQDTLLAERYLGKYETKRQRQEAEQAATNQQYTIQAQQTSLQQSGANEQALKQIEFTSKQKLQETVNAGSTDKVMFEMIRDAILENQKTGQPIPAFIQPYVQPYLQNLAQRMGLQMGNNQLQAVGQQMEMQSVQQGIAQEQEQQQGVPQQEAAVA